MESLSVVFTGQDQVEVRLLAVADPQPGEVLVQTHATLVSSGTEGIILSRRFEANSHWDRWVSYPFRPGYSLVGRIIAVGEGVPDVHVGDRVGVRAPHAQYCVAQANHLYPILDGVSDQEATWFGLANIVQTAIRNAEHTLGDTVVVVGLGLLGQLVVQYARLQGAQQVIAVDTAATRLALARSHGATLTLLGDVQQARDAVLEATDGVGADVVYDVTGAAAVFAVALGLARRLGKVVLLGDTGSPTAQHLTSDLIVKGLRVIGAHDTNRPRFATEHNTWSHQDMTKLFMTYVQRGDMRVSDLITHRFSPTDAPAAYHLLQRERLTTMGVVFDWTQIT